MLSAYARNLTDLVKIVPLVLTPESQIDHSRDKLKRRYASTSPCHTLFLTSKKFVKFSGNLTQEKVGHTVIFMSP